MAGMLAQMLGQSPAEQKAILEEAKENANDLTGLVRKKKPQQQPEPANNTKRDTNTGSSGGNGSGKRKLEDGDGSGLDGKKAKVEG